MVHSSMRSMAFLADEKRGIVLGQRYLRVDFSFRTVFFILTIFFGAGNNSIKKLKNKFFVYSFGQFLSHASIATLFLSLCIF